MRIKLRRNQKDVSKGRIKRTYQKDVSKRYESNKGEANKGEANKGESNKDESSKANGIWTNRSSPMKYGKTGGRARMRKLSVYKSFNGINCP